MNRLAATRFQYKLKSTITQIAIILFAMLKVSFLKIHFSNQMKICYLF